MANARGFTLIELVITMVLISIVSIVGVQFLGQSVSLYSDSADQQHRIADARFVLERLGREISQSHPFSVRDPFADDPAYQGQCLEYIRLAAVGAYRGTAVQGPSLLVRNWPHDHLQTDSIYALTASRRLSIDTQSESELYGSSNTDTVQTIQSVTPGTSTVTLPSAFARDSSGNRFAVLDGTGPTQWCLFSQKLYRFSNYNPTFTTPRSVDWFLSAAANAPSTQASLMAERVSSASVFNIQTTSLARNPVVDVSLRLLVGQSQNPLIFNRRMQVSYVP
jgi:MSHA biogenesis protein MshO